MGGKYLVEGCCDGSLFGEVIAAPDDATAEVLAVDLLNTAWRENAATLDELGDVAMVTPFSPEMYARDAGPELLAVLEYVAAQDNIMLQLQRVIDKRGHHICGNIRAAIAKAKGEVI